MHNVSVENALENLSLILKQLYCGWAKGTKIITKNTLMEFPEMGILGYKFSAKAYIP